MLVPEPGSRRLYAGCRLGRQQAPPRLVPRPKAFSVSTSLRAFDASSTVHFRSSSPVHTWRPLTVAFSATLTTPAVVPAQLAVVWSFPLHGQLRGAYPHRQHGITSGRPIYIGSTLHVRGATFAPPQPLARAGRTRREWGGWYQRDAREGKVPARCVPYRS